MVDTNPQEQEPNQEITTRTPAMPNPALEEMFINKPLHPILGHCYWYAPHPTESDAKCSWCGFIFAKDQEKDAAGAAGLVLVLHQARTGVNNCPACKTPNTLEPLSDWCRVIDITNFYGFGRSFAVVHKKWLTPASEEDVEMEMIGEENRVDQWLGITAPDVYDALDDDDDDDDGEDPDDEDPKEYDPDDAEEG